MAEEEGELKPNTQFSSSDFRHSDQERVFAVIWKQILDRKVYSVFGSYRWYGRSVDDTIFVVK